MAKIFDTNNGIIYANGSHCKRIRYKILLDSNAPGTDRIGSGTCVEEYSKFYGSNAATPNTVCTLGQEKNKGKCWKSEGILEFNKPIHFEFYQVLIKKLSTKSRTCLLFPIYEPNAGKFIAECRNYNILSNGYTQLPVMLTDTENIFDRVRGELQAMNINCFSINSYEDQFRVTHSGNSAYNGHFWIRYGKITLSQIDILNENLQEYLIEPIIPRNVRNVI